MAVDIYRGDAGLDTGRPQSLFDFLDPRLIEQKRLTKVKRVNLAEEGRSPSLTAPWSVSTAPPLSQSAVSHDPGQLWVLVFAMTMMGGLVVSLVVRRRRVWARISPRLQRAGAERLGDRVQRAGAERPGG